MTLKNASYSCLWLKKGCSAAAWESAWSNLSPAHLMVWVQSASFNRAIGRALLARLRGSLHAHQDPIQSSTIEQPAMCNHRGDLFAVPDVLERVCAQQHQVGALAGVD